MENRRAKIERKPAATDRDVNSRRWITACLFLIAATIFTFWPLVRCEFTQFDDPDYVTDNDWVKQGLTWPGVLQAFRDVQTANWHPVTWLSHMLDVQCFGLNPAGHHLTSLFFHTANTALLFLLLRRLTGAVWRSGFVAALFALHPLHVESVAWISERKDVLSGFFFLLTLWAYAGYAKRRSARDYFLTLLCFAFGLMSKPMVVTLPFVLLLLDYWPLQRIRFDGQRLPIKELLPLFREKIPFFALTLASCVVTFCLQVKAGAVTTVDYLPFDTRLANAVASYVGYLQKTYWPSDLAVFYPYTATLQLPKLVLLGALLAGVTTVVVRFARSRPYLAVGWFWFVGMLVPVIGLVQAGVQSMADRYTYLPLVGVFVGVTWGAGELAERGRRGKILLVTLAVPALAACALVTRQQLRYWQNGEELFTRALTVTPNNATAQYNLGVALAARGKTDDACEHFAEAVELHPNHAEALNNLGLCFVLQGDRDAGLDSYRKALAIKPNYPEAHFNLGLALAARSEWSAAIEQYREAIRFRPGFANAHSKLGLALARQGRLAEATTHFGEALRVRPDAQTHHNLAGALVLQGDAAGALAHYREAVRLNPDWPEPINLLAWLLATKREEAIRNGAEAVRLAEAACALSGHTNANFLTTLAAAYAESGRFSEAVETSRRSVELATVAGESELADVERRRLALYRMNQPFRQE